MKKFFIVTVFALCLNSVSFSQNSFEVKIGQSICLDELTLTFTNDETMICQLGCTGYYQFALGELVIAKITVNGKDTYVGTTTTVVVDNNLVVRSTITQSGRTIVDDLNGLIR